MRIYEVSWNVTATTSRIHTHSFHITYANGIVEQGTYTGQGNTCHEMEDFIPGSENVVNASLVDKQNILLPPLQKKIVVVNQFVQTSESVVHASNASVLNCSLYLKLVGRGNIWWTTNSKGHKRCRIHEYNERRRTSGIECIHRNCQEVSRKCKRFSL
jgi:hypothetical protein